MNGIEQIFGPSTSSAITEPKKELGQEDFLKLLVAQLKNQDPNNPADNGEFLGQIAQFSMVSGIDDLGVSFDGIAGSLYANQAMQAAQLVGKQVLSETNTATLGEDQSVDGVIELDSRAAHVKMHVFDEAGGLVRSMDMGDVNAGMQTFNWDGLDDNGDAMAEGQYLILAEGLVNGELTGVPVNIFNKVESVSVDRSNTSVLVHLANKSSVGISQIREFK